MQSSMMLRRGLLGLMVAGSLGFGATQALATPSQASTAAATCPSKGYDYYYASCAYACPGRQGYCSAGGICRCGLIP
ncbi:hypothetical protein [Longimicrobium sp.]|uniref:hypothetical protein n=1 Tax=Longimicrobium sp. TaxID=2029185 RepID=UPI003B3B9C02